MFSIDALFISITKLDSLQLLPLKSHTLPNRKELRTIRDKAAGCEATLKAVERQLSDLEASVPRARMEAEAEQAKALDIQQRLDELRAATEVSWMGGGA